MKKASQYAKWLYPSIILACFLPFISPAIGLTFGILIAILGIQPIRIHTYTSKILQVSIVLLGFGMNLNEVIAASQNGFIATTISVSLVMICGILLGRLFKAEKNTALLIASGTAICGGSAIAAVAAVLGSKDDQNSFALVVVFVLNAIALFLFPLIGQQLGLSQEVFGNWAAIAIHDTSSVVGAGAAYGEEALQIATTVKLIRALWIIPLVFVIAMLQKKAGSSKIKWPWFILFFVLAIVFSNFFPDWGEAYTALKWLGKRGMVIALFLIGSNISVNKIRQSGSQSFVLGIVLWVLTSVVSLLVLNQ